MDDPYAELARVKARIAEMERMAASPPPLHDAIADHYSPLKPPVDPRRKALERAAHGFVADPQSEAALVARAKDVAAYEAQLRAMGASPLELSLYARQREAALAIGLFVPPTPEGDAA